MDGWLVICTGRVGGCFGKAAVKQPDWADRSWLLEKPQIAADTGVKTLTAVMLTLILTLTYWVINYGQWHL
jgi:hypothetical protein